MVLPPLVTKVVCTVAGAEVQGAGLLVHFSPVRGYPPEIVDWIPLGPEGDLAVINGVGRLLRILRAGRLRRPQDPYRLYGDLESAAELVRRCRGAVVHLQVKRSFDRVLTVWTEAGVERISSVLDFQEESDSLSVRRREGQSVLRIPRDSLIRYEASTTESLDVIAVDVGPQLRLP